MKLPGYEKAIVDIAKLTNYCLNPDHPEGRHKARVFQAALGVSQEHADWLRLEILKSLPEGEASGYEETPYGDRFYVDLNLAHGGKTAVVRTGWIIRKSDGMPRLVTCFVR